jgi:hypothetical protein
MDLSEIDAHMTYLRKHYAAGTFIDRKLQPVKSP